MEKTINSYKIVTGSKDGTVVIGQIAKNTTDDKYKFQIRDISSLSSIFEDRVLVLDLIIFKKDPNLLVIACANTLKNIKVWDMLNQKLVNELVTSGNSTQTLSILEKENFLITGHDKGILLIWNDFKLIKKIELGKVVNNITKILTSDKSLVIALSNYSNIMFVDFKEGKVTHELPAHEKEVQLIERFEFYSNRLVSYGGDKFLRVWNDDFTKYDELNIDTSVSHMTTLKNKNNILVLTNYLRSEFEFWDLYSKKLIKKTERPDFNFSFSIELSPNLILFGGETYELWEFKSSEEIVPVSDYCTWHTSIVNKILLI